MIERFLTWLLGPRCDLCGTRVYAADQPTHDRLDHAGDRRP